MRTKALGALSCLIVVLEARAWAAGASLYPGTSRSVPCDHKTCTEVQTVLHGSAPGGGYSVPVTLLYPPARQCSGVAVLDLPNTIGTRITFSFQPVPFIRELLGDDFIGDQGYVYAAVQWDAPIAYPSSPYGQIAQMTDGYEIIADMAAYLRTSPVCPAQVVLAAGFSQTGSLVRDLLVHGHNVRDGRLVVEGAVGVVGGFNCWPLAVDGATACSAVDVKGKLISVASETDVIALGAAFAREKLDDYRYYEIAGASHLQKGISPVPTSSQNPVSIGPVVRAAVSHIEDWITSAMPPPESTEIACFPFPDGTCFTYDLFGNPPAIDLLDHDLNAEGGVRLPHMLATPDVVGVGAPLGSYSGLDLPSLIAWLNCGGYSCPDPFLTFDIFGGSFAPFDAAKLAARYPTHDAYVEAVAAGARAAYEKGWILWPDVVNYVTTAAHCPVGQTSVLSAADFDACHGL
jgi:hypothetical protein